MSYILSCPVIAPRCYPDENPMGYILRLAYNNRYTSYHWLLNHRYQYPIMLTNDEAYQYVISKNWTGYTAAVPLVREIYWLPYKKILSTFIKYCPLCLKEAQYYRAHWLIRSFSVCLTHRVWLQEKCPQCHKAIVINCRAPYQCKCGLDLCRVEAKPAPLSILPMQYFLQTGKVLDSKFNELSLLKDMDISLAERIDLIDFSCKWQPDLIKMGRQKGKEFLKKHEKDQARNIQLVATSTFFNDSKGFLKYLYQLDHLPEGCTVNHQSPFVRFYRAFYKRFPEEYFLPYRRLIEKYIKHSWTASLTKRNRLFDSSTITDYPWITFKQSCSEFNIFPLKLRRAIKDNLIIHIVAKKSSRNFILFYRPSVKQFADTVEEMKTFKETTKILGITKSQLTDLLDDQHFLEAIPPKEEYSSVWQFPMRSLENYLNKVNRYVARLDGECVSLAATMRIIGNRIENPFSTTLNAIFSRQIPITAEDLHCINRRIQT